MRSEWRGETNEECFPERFAIAREKKFMQAHQGIGEEAKGCRAPKNFARIKWRDVERVKRTPLAGNKEIRCSFRGYRDLDRPPLR